MKRILHVVNVFFVVPYFFGNQFPHLGKKGYDQHLICSPSPLLKDYANRMGIRYREVRVNKSFTPFQDVLAIAAICRYIGRNRINIVVGHTPKGAFVSMIAALLMRVPCRIYFRHGLVYETMKGLPRLAVIISDKITALCANKVICVSRSVYRRSLEDRLNPERKQMVLLKGTCGGVDTVNKFNPDYINQEKLEKLRASLGIESDCYVVGFVGRLVKDKGVQELVEAFDLIRKEKPAMKFRLLLVGGTENRDGIPGWLMKKIDEDPHIVNPGLVFEDVEYYYAMMDILVLPTYREGFPISVVEASAMRLPVLTTRETGAIDSIIEGVTGEFIEHDPVSIRDSVLRFTDRNYAMKYGSNGRKFVTINFDSSLFLKEFEKLYA